MGVTPTEAREIVDSCRRNGVACGVPFIVRYAPAYREAQLLIQSGTIGEVTGFRITYRADKGDAYWSSGHSGRVTTDWRRTWAKAGGGVLIMNTIHDLDAVLWITGLEVEYVQGVMANTHSPAEVEDIGMALFTCSGGGFGSLEAHSALAGGQGPGQRWINRIYGSEGQILLPTPWSTDALAVFTRRIGQWQERVSTDAADARRLAFEGFAAAVLARQPVPIPGEAGLRASWLVHKLYESARRGERIAVEHANM
jgi:predicted dehydrogenase